MLACTADQNTNSDIFGGALLMKERLNERPLMLVDLKLDFLVVDGALRPLWGQTCGLKFRHMLYLQLHFTKQHIPHCLLPH